MRERLLWVRWVFLVVGVAVLVLFLVAQRQSQGVDVSYGQSPSVDKVMEGDGDELTDQTIPSTADIQQRVDSDRVVILPGAVAQWDERRVSDALGDSDLRILVAPPGLSEEQKDQLDDVEGVDIQIVGTSVTGGIFGATNNNIAGWRAEFATGDVTNLLVALIARELDEEHPSDVDLLDRRIVTDSELAAVATDFSAGRRHAADGATLEAVPESAELAFPDEQPLVAAFPRQEFGEAMPDYGSALTERFPGKPILVMYGDWIEYHGPQAGEFAEIAAQLLRAVRQPPKPLGLPAAKCAPRLSEPSHGHPLRGHIRPSAPVPAVRSASGGAARVAVAFRGLRAGVPRAVAPAYSRIRGPAAAHGACTSCLSQHARRRDLRPVARSVAGPRHQEAASRVVSNR
ncbi:hypothetical protein [Hoyosella altamirensis]|uniref:Uncharacterized protein n=1 Tax=Hoyosella altamirensis TaxID=616997 RepID=A0A839RQ55_9ACTN|nr:hypothetical protein [Hoyosella altamirensis]MBB3038011.1 hypothetical protein [Hoyosella altamirensis]